MYIQTRMRASHDNYFVSVPFFGIEMDQFPTKKRRAEVGLGFQSFHFIILELYGIGI